MINMKNILKYILLAGVAVAFSSCTLDLFPKKSIVYNEDEPIIQKESDLTSFEVGIVNNFRATQSGGYYSLDDVMCDAFNATVDFGNRRGSVHRTDASFTAGDSDIQSIWGNWYIVIKNYNIAIAAANSIEDEGLKEKAKTMLGEAYFFRAFTYLNLARHFGVPYSEATADKDLCVPLILVYNQNERPARATVKQVYDQIKADLDNAAELLADVPGAVRAQRPTIDAVKALYARYYIDIKNNEKAAEYAMELIKSGTYTLSSTAAEMRSEFVSDTGNEPIMQMYASQQEVPASLALYTNISDHDGRTYAPDFLPSQKLLDTYDDSDLRRISWFKKSGSASYPIYMSGTKHNNEAVVVFTKFEGNPAYVTTGVPSGNNAVKPFRISEMYLIAAEAYAASGDTPNATLVLNELQSKRGAELSSTATMAAVQQEWFKETVGEGMRTICLKRWNQGFTARTAQPAAIAENLLNTGEYYNQRKMEAGDYHLVWPIPNYELKINNNLVQNKGYSVVEGY